MLKTCGMIVPALIFSIFLYFGEIDSYAQDCQDGPTPTVTGNPFRSPDWWSTIEITPPSRYVYSIIDGSITPHQFNYIKLNLRNNAPEEIQEGTLCAAARYKKRIDYDPALQNDPPTAESREEFFSISRSKLIYISSLSATDSEEFQFDFSNDPIPVGITDLSLIVLFTGKKGGEAGNIALGSRDLCEPTHISVSNSTDRFYLAHVLRTANEIKNSPNLLAMVDFDGDGVPNEEEEPYIDPFDLSIGLAVYPINNDLPDPSDYSAVYFDMHPGKYGKFVILTDSSEYNLLLHYEYELPYTWNVELYALSLSGVINQDDDQGDWHNTQVYTLRGITQHYPTLYAHSHPDSSGMYSAVWPPFADEPVSIDTLRP